MDGINVKSLEEHSEGDVASPSSSGTQVLQPNYSKFTDNIYFSEYSGLVTVCQLLDCSGGLGTVVLVYT